MANGQRTRHSVSHSTVNTCEGIQGDTGAYQDQHFCYEEHSRPSILAYHKPIRRSCPNYSTIRNSQQQTSFAHISNIIRMSIGEEALQATQVHEIYPNVDSTEGDDPDEEFNLLPLPLTADMPLLDVELDEEQEADVILVGDIARLPNMTVVDENGCVVKPCRLPELLGESSSDSTSSADGDTDIARVLPGAMIKSGVLFKQGFHFLNRGWKARYVELTSSKLIFYTQENGRKRGSVDLTSCSSKSIQIMPKDSVFDGAHGTMWRFAIVVKGRRLLFSAHSEADMKGWLRCLRFVLVAQEAGPGRYTDVFIPSGSLLIANRGGQMRSSRA